MKSGPGQERVGHTHKAGCGAIFYYTAHTPKAKTIKVKGEWILNIISTTQVHVRQRATKKKKKENHL